MATNLIDIPVFDLEKPTQLAWKKPTQLAWKKFESHVSLMFEGPLSGKSAKVKCSYLLLWLGDVGREIHSTWDLADNEANDVAVILKKFNEHITPKGEPSLLSFQLS